ncbi:MAG: ATP-grasp domain-containing protein [Pseudomonadota bacterium]|nr:ATP-grasp domain-containing protein [Pseudomonadota bacterium]
MTRPFHKLLVANRGEIACRIIRSARDQGYRTVAIASEADAEAPHSRLADELVVIGPASVGQSYLDPQRVLDAARKTGADAVHPGYGFLSENAEFARLCGAAGLVFVGPSPDAIVAMGDKAEAKRRMMAAGVPCVPGYEGEDQSDDRLAGEAARIGFPVMIKAVAGGGGRGMRLVNDPVAFADALVSARSEAQNAFGNSTILLERAIAEPRHVEIQVFGDTLGNVIHLGERDCSVQRRHQKVIEEAPSPAVDPALRVRMGEAATEAAKAIDYVGAGTVEFLLGKDGAFHFLEMNTRLQVEHPVTELVTGLDLVAMQLAVAAGQPLPVTQDQVTITGLAIEGRLYAENPYDDFLPQSGKVELWEPPVGEGIRIDHGVRAGVAVSSFYDAMVAKIIAWGPDRGAALRRLERAVGDTVLLGPQTNKTFLLALLAAPEFRDGKATTAFIGQIFPDGPAAPVPPFALGALAAVLAVHREGGGWRSNRWMGDPVAFALGEQKQVWRVVRSKDGWRADCDGRSASIGNVEIAGHRVRWSECGVVRTAAFFRDAGVILIDDGSTVSRFREESGHKETMAGRSDGVLRAPMTGTIVSIVAAAGQTVSRGQILLTLEAMKMEHQLISPLDGTIETIGAAAGDQVSARDVLIVIAAEGV